MNATNVWRTLSLLYKESPGPVVYMNRQMQSLKLQNKNISTREVIQLLEDAAIIYPQHQQLIELLQQQSALMIKSIKNIFPEQFMTILHQLIKKQDLEKALQGESTTDVNSEIPDVNNPRFSNASKQLSGKQKYTDMRKRLVSATAITGLQVLQSYADHTAERVRAMLRSDQVRYHLIQTQKQHYVETLSMYRVIVAQRDFLRALQHKQLLIFKISCDRRALREKLMRYFHSVSLHGAEFRDSLRGYLQVWNKYLIYCIIQAKKRVLSLSMKQAELKDVQNLPKVFNVKAKMVQRILSYRVTRIRQIALNMKLTLFQVNKVLSLQIQGFNKKTLELQQHVRQMNRASFRLMEGKKLGQLQDSLTSITESKKLTLSGQLRHYKAVFENSGLQVQPSVSNSTDRFRDINRKELNNQIGMLVQYQQVSSGAERQSDLCLSRISEKGEVDEESIVCFDITPDERLYFINSKLKFLLQLTLQHQKYHFREQYHYLLLKLKLCTVIRYKKYQAKRQSLIHMLIRFKHVIVQHQQLLRTSVMFRFRPIQHLHNEHLILLETYRTYLVKAKSAMFKERIKQITPRYIDNYNMLVRQLNQDKDSVVAQYFHQYQEKVAQHHVVVMKFKTMFPDVWKYHELSKQYDNEVYSLNLIRSRMLHVYKNFLRQHIFVEITMYQRKNIQYKIIQLKLLVKKPLLYQRRTVNKLVNKQNQYNVIYYTYVTKKASLKLKLLQNQIQDNLIDFSPQYKQIFNQYSELLTLTNRYYDLIRKLNKPQQIFYITNKQREILTKLQMQYSTIQNSKQRIIKNRQEMNIKCIEIYYLVAKKFSIIKTAFRMQIDYYRKLYLKLELNIIRAQQSWWITLYGNSMLFRIRREILQLKNRSRRRMQVLLWNKQDHKTVKQTDWQQKLAVKRALSRCPSQMLEQPPQSDDKQQNDTVSEQSEQNDTNITSSPQDSMSNQRFRRPMQAYKILEQIAEAPDGELHEKEDIEVVQQPKSENCTINTLFYDELDAEIRESKIQWLIKELQSALRKMRGGSWNPDSYRMYFGTVIRFLERLMKNEEYLTKKQAGTFVEWEAFELFICHQAEEHFDLKSKAARRLFLAIAGLMDLGAEFIWRPQLCFPQVMMNGAKIFTGM